MSSSTERLCVTYTLLVRGWEDNFDDFDIFLAPSSTFFDSIFCVVAMMTNSSDHFSKMAPPIAAATQ